MNITQVEVSHEYPHRILTIHDVLSDKEADSLAALALPRMRQASVGHGKEGKYVSSSYTYKQFFFLILDKFHMFCFQRNVNQVSILHQNINIISSFAHPSVSEGRVSRNCWLKDFESSIVDKISARINWITGLQTSRPLDVHKEGKVEEYEPLQVCC